MRASILVTRRTRKCRVDYKTVKKLVNSSSWVHHITPPTWHLLFRSYRRTVSFKIYHLVTWFNVQHVFYMNNIPSCHSTYSIPLNYIHWRLRWRKNDGITWNFCEPSWTTASVTRIIIDINHTFKYSSYINDDSVIDQISTFRKADWWAIHVHC